MNLQTAYSCPRAAEVTFPGTVATAPAYFYGRRTHCEHEEFTVQTSSGPVDVIDNVGLAPPVRVAPGDAVVIRGEMVHDRGRPPVVHWTHRDPRGTHEDGFIRVGGKTYA